MKRRKGRNWIGGIIKWRRKPIKTTEMICGTDPMSPSWGKSGSGRYKWHKSWIMHRHLLTECNIIQSVIPVRIRIVISTKGGYSACHLCYGYANVTQGMWWSENGTYMNVVLCYRSYIYIYVVLCHRGDIYLYVVQCPEVVFTYMLCCATEVVYTRVVQ